jgi:hypothetical protein
MSRLLNLHLTATLWQLQDYILPPLPASTNVYKDYECCEGYANQHLIERLLCADFYLSLLVKIINVWLRIITNSSIIQAKAAKIPSIAR